ncbi:Membrane-bound lytic murein transglycosylase F [bacterium HR30]|nr:Membrane-bound lytic murein transglycosylase F [bacterium HR30]
MRRGIRKFRAVPFVAGALLSGALTVAGWWWSESAVTPVSLPVGVAEVSTSVSANASADGKRWVIGLDGWKIAVDGGELASLRVEELWESAEQALIDPGLSPFDRWIVSYSQAAGLDWELVAAIIAEESNFDPDAVSERGAVGLMQVRPIAASQVGEEQFADPESNIRTGVRYLVYLNELFADVVEGERLPFVIAAYHMGPAHVRDAQEIARRLGLDPRRWHGHVARVLPLLEIESFYRFLPAGYAQGRKTLDYVGRVLARYQRLVREG